MENKEIPYEIKLRKAKFLDDEEFLRMNKLDENDILIIKTTVEKMVGSPIDYLMCKYLKPVNEVKKMEFEEKKENNYQKYSWICPRCKDDALILQRNSVGLYFFCKNCKLDSSNLGKNKRGTKISIYAKPEQQGYTKAYKNLSNVFYLVHLLLAGNHPVGLSECGEWDVKLNDNCGYTTKSQDHAEIISRLIRLEIFCRKIRKDIEELRDEIG